LNSFHQSTTIKLLLALAALTISSCQSSSKPTPKPEVVVWKPLETWSGRGSTQTESFEINTAQWRVAWETRNETSPGAGRFVLTANSAISGRVIAEAADARGVGKDIAYISDFPRMYHLVIDSKNVDWSVTAEVPIVINAEHAK
jgi:hypothetical protein